MCNVRQLCTLDQTKYVGKKNGQNPHTNHADHQLIYADLISLNNIKDQCIEAKKICEGRSANISASK